MFIQTEKNPDGSHAFQIGGVQQDGWAYVPEELARPASFPYCSIETALVTHPAEKGQAAFTRLEVISMTEGEEIPVEGPESGEPEENKALLARIAALEEQLAAAKILLGVE